MVSTATTGGVSAHFHQVGMKVLLFHGVFSDTTPKSGEQNLVTVSKHGIHIVQSLLPW